MGMGLGYAYWPAFWYVFFKVSMFQGFHISGFRLGFEVSRVSIFRRFGVSRFRVFKESRFRSFKVSRFQGFEVLKNQDFRVSRFKV
jgi:hypothetical protein